MKHVMIVPFGDDMENIYPALRSFETSKIILVVREKDLDKAEKVEKELEKFKLPLIKEIIKGNVMEEMLRIFNKIRRNEEERNIIVNIATGDKVTSCAALSSAFVNGFMAFGIMDNELFLFPVLKFTYQELLSGKKKKILKLLSEKTLSLKELHQEMKLSLPLLSYHLQGSEESKGLVGLGLVELNKENKKTKIKLTSLGQLLLKGFLD